MKSITYRVKGVQQTFTSPIELNGVIDSFQDGVIYEMNKTAMAQKLNSDIAIPSSHILSELKLISIWAEEDNFASIQNGKLIVFQPFFKIELEIMNWYVANGMMHELLNMENSAKKHLPAVIQVIAKHYSDLVTYPSLLTNFTSKN